MAHNEKKAHIILTTKPAHALARTHIIEHIIYIFFIQNSKGPRWQQLRCDITFFPMNTHSQCKRTSLNLTRIWHMSLKLHLESFFFSSHSQFGHSICWSKQYSYKKPQSDHWFIRISTPYSSRLLETNDRFYIGATV